MSTGQTKTKNICTQLLNEMKTGIFAECSRLPRETELSEKLGISRTQLRDVLSELEREGFITRRHGVGTIINHHVLQVKNRMDIETEFFDIIEQSGYTPKTVSVRYWERKAGAYIAEKLNISEDADVVWVSRICKADDQPAIYCEDVFEKQLIKNEYTNEDLALPFFQFLQKVCGVDAYMDLTELHAAAADETVAEALKIAVGTPVLNMEEVDFDIEGRPVLYSSQYFVEGLFQQTVLRKKL